MSSSLSMPRGMETINPSPEISRYYNKANAPYTNTAQVLSEVLSVVRYVGQTFLVVDEEWWFKSGKLNTDLVLKQDSGTGITDLDYTPSPTQGTVTSSTGTDAIISLADNTNAGLMSPSDKETLYDNVIYRSGTEAGKPITGDLEINGDGDERFIFNGNNPAPLYKNGIWFTDDGLTGFKSTDGTNTTTLLNQNAQFALDSTNTGFKGIVGSNFFDKEEDLNAFAQLGDLTPLENDIFELQMNKANQDTTYTKTEVDAKVASVYKIRGSVANFAALPSSGQVSGDVWNLLDNGDNYAWVLDLNNTGVAGWDKLSGSVDLTAYETKVVAESKYLQIVNASATVLATVLTGISFLTGGTIVSTDSVLVAFGKFQKQLNDFGTALGLKQDTLTDTNFGIFTNSVADKNTQADNDVLAYLDVTTGKWVKQTFSKLADYLKGFFQTSRIIVTSNITAVNGSVYHNNGNNTYADPTPENNKGFSVKVISGTATIGGVDFGIGTIVERDYDGTDWKNEVYVSAKNQIEFSGNKTVVTTWFGKEVTCVSTGVLTIPASLPDEFNFCLRADAGVSISWAITSPHTWRVMGLAVGVAPATMTAGQFCQVSKRKGTNEIRISGL